MGYVYRYTCKQEKSWCAGWEISRGGEGRKLERAGVQGDMGVEDGGGPSN